MHPGEQIGFAAWHKENMINLNLFTKQPMYSYYVLGGNNNYYFFGLLYENITDRVRMTGKVFGHLEYVTTEYVMTSSVTSLVDNHVLC